MPIKDAVTGAGAGLVAVLPMTGVMALVNSLLPERDQRALPPREISQKAAEKTGAGRPDDEENLILTGFTHTGFSVAAGALYGTIAGRVPIPPVASGVLFGVGVWAVSYLGWLPALRLYGTPEEQPKGRNAMMVIAHLVWGASLGLAWGKRGR